MNIQIFGTKKCFDTKKAMRYFKERNIKFQMIDILDKGMSKGEFNRVKQALGGANALVDEGCKDKELLALIHHIVPEDLDELILENQKIIKTPIVRNGNKATAGYEPKIWENWKD